MSEKWSAEARQATMRFPFDDGSFYEQRLIEQYLKPGDQSRGKFWLYYFVKDQTYDNYPTDDKKPTILFAAGGPGQMILPDTENFADMYGYRTVYFHLRGTGFSQLENTEEADDYIRTSYVVRDIEIIRKDLLHDNPWTAVIGHSYGGLVVQCYANTYKEKAGKVILSAPIVPDKLLPDQKNGKNLMLESLTRIYETEPFQFLKIDGGLPGFLVKEVERISLAAEEDFGSVQYVGDNYKSLQKELQAKGLDYGPAFFGAVRRLRHVGWLPLDVPYAKPISSPKVDDTQVQCGLVIAKALLEKHASGDIEKVFKDGDVRKEKLSAGERRLGGRSTQNTSRPYYLISMHDGLNQKLVRNFDKLKAIANHPVSAMTKSVSGKQTQWKIDDLKHDRPTLILTGGADPVTEQGQGEYYFKHALSSKEKILFEFPGVGHSMALPNLNPPKAEEADPLTLRIKKVGEAGDEIVRFLSPRDKLIDEFLNTGSIADLRNSKIVQALEAAFKTSFDQLGKDVVNGIARDSIVKNPTRINQRSGSARKRFAQETV